MNRHDSIEQAKGPQPDVMMLDIEMPSMNGFPSIQSYDDHHPLPSIMECALTDEGAGLTLQALARCGVDFIEFEIVNWYWGCLLRREK